MTQVTIPKPWGHEVIWAHTYKYVGKKLFIKDGHRLSLQFHKVKDETIYILSGELTFQFLQGSSDPDKTHETKILKPGDSFHIPPYTVHRMIAANGDVEVMEVSTIELEDVVRLEDNYGRTGK